MQKNKKQHFPAVGSVLVHILNLESEQKVFTVSSHCCLNEYKSLHSLVGEAKMQNFPAPRLFPILSSWQKFSVNPVALSPCWNGLERLSMSWSFQFPDPSCLRIKCNMAPISPNWFFSFANWGQNFVPLFPHPHSLTHVFPAKIITVISIIFKMSAIVKKFLVVNGNSGNDDEKEGTRFRK